MSVQQEAETEGAYPLIHIECHGAEDRTGLVLADGIGVSWKELKPILTRINVATRCNLVVVVAACYGGYLGEIVGITDRAPCWALIGPTASALPDELLGGYGVFYQEFLTSLDGGKAINALNAWKLRDGRFYFMPAGGFFRLAFAGYLKRYCTEDALEERAGELRRRLKASGLERLPGRGRLRRELKKQSKPAFQKYLRHFFMMDLYPENEARFPIKFEDVEGP